MNLPLPLTGDQAVTLRAALDRVIPPDDFPGGWDGAAGYFARQLSGDLADLAVPYALWLDALNAECMALHAVPFAELSPENQDAVLLAVEAGSVTTPWPLGPQEFISLLSRHAAEGFYSDPGNGGNAGMSAWDMVGFASRLETT